MKVINLGIIGAGTVGRSVIKILNERRRELTARTGLEFRVKAVVDRSWEKKADVLAGIPASDDIALLTDDPQIDIILELIGGLEPAGSYIKKALEKGKRVVTANKALLANSGREIFKVAADARREIGFEAAVAGALPVIKNTRRGLVADEVHALYGILNGTCNFIITKMQDEHMDYGDALKLAQDLGFAEADPAFDVNGNDAAQKLALLAGLCFDTYVGEEDVGTEGIANIRRVDLEIAASMGWVIRLLGVARREKDGKLFLRVHPAMIHREHILASVVAEKNAVFFDTSYSGPALVMGSGAGGDATAAAVISDVTAIARRLDVAEPETWMPLEKRVEFATDYSYRYYLRFQTVDRPGVLAEISRVLAEKEISIAQFHQQEGSEPVDMVLLTHLADERRLMEAVREIDQLPQVLEPTIHIRIEDHL